MITGSTELVEAMSQFPVKMEIKVVRMPPHQHADGSTHAGEWAVLAQPKDEGRVVTKIEPWMVGAISAAISKLQEMQAQMAGQLIADLVVTNVETMDLMAKVQAEVAKEPPPDEGKAN